MRGFGHRLFAGATLALAALSAGTARAEAPNDSVLEALRATASMAFSFWRGAK